MLRGMKIRCCSVGCVLISVASAQAQVTDVSQKVADALRNYGAVPLTTTVQVPRETTVCQVWGPPPHMQPPCFKRVVYDTKSSMQNVILIASNIRVIKSGVIEYGIMQSHDLPDHIIPGDNLAENCSAETNQQEYTVTTTFQRTASVALSQSIIHSATYGGSVGATISEVFKVGANVSFTDGNTTTTIDTSDKSYLVTTIRSGTQTLPPKSFELIELETWPVQYTVPFTTTVTIDGDLSPNDKHLQHISDVLGEPQRTFSIAGTVEAQDASSGVLKFFDVSYNASKCVQGVREFKPSKATKLIERSDQK
jgi:hypothetical protein